MAPTEAFKAPVGASAAPLGILVGTATGAATIATASAAPPMAGTPSTADMSASEAPLGPSGAPMRASGALVGVFGVPMEDSVEYTKVSGVYSAASRAPMRASQTPLGASGEYIGASEELVGAVKAFTEASEAPLEASGAPVEASGAPSEPSGAPIRTDLSASPDHSFPIPPLPTPLPLGGIATGSAAQLQQRWCSCPLRTWLRRTFPPIVLVGGTAAAKREVAALTGLTLASLFQPFNGEAVAARLVAATAAAAEHRKHEELRRLSLQQQQKQKQQSHSGKQAFSRESENDTQSWRTIAEPSEEEFLCREGYHPSHVYRYFGLLKDSTNVSNCSSGNSGINSETRRTGVGGQLSAGSSAYTQQESSSLPRYIKDIPPLNLLLQIATPCNNAKSSSTAPPDTTLPGGPTANSSSALSSGNKTVNTGSVTGISSTSSNFAAGDTTGFVSSVAASPFGTETRQNTVSSNTSTSSGGSIITPHSINRNTNNISYSNNDYFCVRFIDLEDAEPPSSLAADALAMRALTQAPPPLQDLSTYTAAAAGTSSPGTPSSSFTSTSLSLSGVSQFQASEGVVQKMPSSPPSRRGGPVFTTTMEMSPEGSPSLYRSPASVLCTGYPSTAAMSAEVRKSGVRSSAISPFIFPAEGSSASIEAAATNSVPLASTTGCRGTDLLWYEEWERIIFESLRFSEHETLSQPVGLVLVASSRDVDPAHELQQLLQPQRLPSLCSRFVLDPNPARAFVLLDIHPNALQARADLTTACLQRKCRSHNMQQQPLQTRQGAVPPPSLQQQKQRSQYKSQHQGGVEDPSGTYSKAGPSGDTREAADGSNFTQYKSIHTADCGKQATNMEVELDGPLSHGDNERVPLRGRASMSGGIMSRHEEELEEEAVTRSDPARVVAQWHQQQQKRSSNFSKGLMQQQQSAAGQSTSTKHATSNEKLPENNSPALSRGEILLEQMCAAFPPANCHLLTLGHGTGSPAYWQLLPAIRFLYAQSLKPSFSSLLSAGRTPVMLSGSQNVVTPSQFSPRTSPSPFLPLLRLPVDASCGIRGDNRLSSTGCRNRVWDAAAASGGAAGGVATTNKKTEEEEAAAAAVAATTGGGEISAANIDWLLCSGYQLPVASRLTLPPAMCNVGGGVGVSRPSQAHPASLPGGATIETRGTAAAAVAADSTAAAAAALGHIENSFCVGLSWADLHALSAFVQHLVHTGVLPWVERKTQQLETAISSSRRGFRNQLRYLWRKPKGSGAVAASNSSPAGGPGGASAAVAGLASLSNVVASRTGRSGVVASAAEQATGAAEAILSVVGGALLGDTASSLYSTTSLLHLGGASSKSSQQEQPFLKGSYGGFGDPASSVGDPTAWKTRGTAAAGKLTGGTGLATGAAAGCAAPPPTAYQLHTVEWQYRLQADLYFFLGNFEAALQSLRYCSADFKQDKRWMQLGGAYEMQALCLYLTGASRREIDACIEHGYNAFVKAAAGRLALRCVLLGLRITMEMVAAALPLPLPWNPLSPMVSLRQRVRQLPPSAAVSAASAESAALETARQLLAANVELPVLDTPTDDAAALARAGMGSSQPHEDAATAAPDVSEGRLLAKGPASSTSSVDSSPPNASAAAGQQQQQHQQQQQQAAVAAFRAQSWAIRSAMLLEQAALCHEQAGLGHRRKKNFQLVMAGHTYYKAGYKRLALRCYTAVVSQYEWCGWQHVAQHLRFIMARQAFSLHMLLDAVFNFAALLDAVACMHHTRRLVSGALPSTMQKAAALQDDSVAALCSSSTSASSSALNTSTSSSLWYLHPSANTSAAGSYAGATRTYRTEVATVAGSAASSDSHEIKSESGSINAAALMASLGLPEVSAQREAHYVREFVFVCRVILERQKQQLEQQQRAARAQRRGKAADSEKESHKSRGRLSYDKERNSGAPSPAVGGSITPFSGDTVQYDVSSAAKTLGGIGVASQTNGHAAASATVKVTGSTSQPVAAGAPRTASQPGGKASSGYTTSATPTLTLPVGLRVPYVECCNKQGVFRDAIEVRLQGDASISSEIWFPRKIDESPAVCEGHAELPAPIETAVGVASSSDLTSWASPREMLRLLEAATYSSSTASPQPIVSLCELAQYLLPQQQRASVGDTKLLFAEQQELQLQETFLDKASEAWIDTQFEATLKRLSSPAASAAARNKSLFPDPVADDDVGKYKEIPFQNAHGGLLDTGGSPVGEAAASTDVDAVTNNNFSATLSKDDIWILDQLRMARLRAWSARPEDGRGGGRGTSTKSCSAIYEQLTRRMPVGSPVHVFVCLVNPLRLPLDCRNVRLVGSIQTNTPSAAWAGGAVSLSSSCAADSPTGGNSSALRGAPQQQHQKQPRKIKKLIEFPSIPAVSLAPLETAYLRLAAVPLVQGKLRIKGLSLDLFGFIRITQPFCLHGSLRQERQYNLRHCRLFSSEDSVAYGGKGLGESMHGSGAPDVGGRHGPSLYGANGTASAEGACDASAQEIQASSAVINTTGQPELLGLSHGNSQSSPEEQELEGGLPISFIVRAENYKLLPTGLPVEALRWRFRQRALETHKEDCRLQLLVDETLPLLSFSFIGWPDAQTPSSPEPLRSQQWSDTSTRPAASTTDGAPLATQEGAAAPCPDRQATAAAERPETSHFTEKREAAPTSNSTATAMFEPLLAVDALGIPLRDSKHTRPASSPVAMDACKHATGFAESSRAALRNRNVHEKKNTSSTRQQPEHLYVGQCSTCLLQVSLASRSQPLQALLLAVSPASMVRFQSAVLVLPRGVHMPLSHLGRRGTPTHDSKEGSHVTYGGGCQKDVPLCKPSIETVTTRDSHAAELLPLVLVEEASSTSGMATKGGGQQQAVSSTANPRCAPAGLGPAPVSDAYKSSNIGRHIKKGGGGQARRDGLYHGAIENCGADSETEMPSVQVIRVLRQPVAAGQDAGAANAVAGGEFQQKNAGERDKEGYEEELMTGGSTVRLQLVLHALQAGIHRVRFCVRAVAAARAAAEDVITTTASAKEGPGHVLQQQLHKKNSSRKYRSSTLWRGIEKVLVVRESLQLTVEPRLSWKHPNRHLLLCRVKNLSSATFCIEQMAAFLPCWLRATYQSEEEAATAATSCDVCCYRCGLLRPGTVIADTQQLCPACCSLEHSSSGSLQQQQREQQSYACVRTGARRGGEHGKEPCEVRVVQLLPCNKRQQHDPVVGPYETLHLLYAAQQKVPQTPQEVERTGRLQQKKEGVRTSPHKLPGQAAATLPEDARCPAVVEGTNDTGSNESFEDDDALEPALCAGTTIQVGLGWRLAAPLATAADVSTGNRAERPHRQQHGAGEHASADTQLLSVSHAKDNSVVSKASPAIVSGEQSLTAVPRGLVLATSPVELSPRLLYIPLRMQVIVCMPPAALHSPPPSSPISAEAGPLDKRISSSYASEAGTLLARWKQLSSTRSEATSCCVRQVRFLLQNTSSSLLLRLQLLADLEAAAHALPLRLYPGAAGYYWDSQRPYCLTRGSMCSTTERTNLSSNSIGRPITSVVCAGGAEPSPARLSSPSEDAAAHKLLPPYRSGDGGSASTLSTTTGSTGAASSAMSSPSRLAAALIHRLPLAPPSSAVPVTTSKGGGSSGEAGAGSSATYTGGRGASATGAIGLGAPLFQFLAPPFPAAQKATFPTVETGLHQRGEWTTTNALSASADLQQQQQGYQQDFLVRTSQFSASGDPPVFFPSTSSSAADGVAAAHALLQQIKRQPQCYAQPAAIGTSVARSLDNVSSRIPSLFVPDDTGRGPLPILSKSNDTVTGGSAEQSQNMLPSRGESAANISMGYSSAYYATTWRAVSASLDVGDSVEDQHLQSLGMGTSDVEGSIVPEIIELTCSSSSCGTDSRYIGTPSAVSERVDLLRRTQGQNWKGQSSSSDVADALSASGERHESETTGEEEALHVDYSPRDAARRPPGGGRDACSGFYWIGKPEQHLGCVGPGQKVEASLLAFFPSSGVFNVNKVYVRVRVAGHVLSGRRSNSNNYTSSIASQGGSTIISSPTTTGHAQNEGQSLMPPQWQPATTEGIRRDELFSVMSLSAESSHAHAPRNGGGIQLCSSDDNTDRRQKAHYVRSDKFFCRTQTAAELQWEAKLAHTSCETVVGFPMECPVYIQPIANGGGAM